jgi:hypothetical protein
MPITGVNSNPPERYRSRNERLTNIILNRLFCKAEPLELELEEPELEPSEEPPMLELEPLGLVGAEDEQKVGARLTMRSDNVAIDYNLYLVYTVLYLPTCY